MWKSIKCWLGVHSWDSSNYEQKDEYPTCDKCGTKYHLNWGQCDDMREIHAEIRKLRKKLNELQQTF